MDFSVLFCFCVGLLSVSDVSGRFFKRNLIRPGRIVGGKELPPGSTPWQVSLQMSKQHFCGGTLVLEGWVVTAAHCTKDIDFKKVKAIVGAFDLEKENTEYNVKKVFRQRYDTSTMEHDLAILQLEEVPKRTVDLGRPVRIETVGEVTGQKCLVSGWGREASGGGALPNKIRGALVELRSDEDCFEAFKGYSLFKTNVCAGGAEKDACQGDSGGPLVCCDQEDDLSSCRLTGVVSWGIGCATPGKPGVYTELAHYNRWIHDTINNNSDKNIDEKDLFYIKSSDDTEEDQLVSAEAESDDDVNDETDNN